MCLPVVEGARAFSHEYRSLNSVTSGMNGFATIHHGLKLWENGAMPLGIIFKYLPDLF